MRYQWSSCMSTGRYVLSVNQPSMAQMQLTAQFRQLVDQAPDDLVRLLQITFSDHDLQVPRYVQAVDILPFQRHDMVYVVLDPSLLLPPGRLLVDRLDLL